MGQISVTLNGRRYDLACDDGQEEHVRGLAGDIGRRVEGLVEGLGQVGEGRLLLLAALLVADELAEARVRLATAEGLLGGGETPLLEMPGRLCDLATRIEAVAARLKGP